MFSRRHLNRVVPAITAAFFIVGCGEVVGVLGGVSDGSVIGDTASNETSIRGRSQCEITPDPVPIGETYSMSLRGLRAREEYTVIVDESGSLRSLTVVTDSQGTAVAALVAEQPGPGLARVESEIKNGSRKLRVTCAFEVVESQSCEDCGPVCGDDVCEEAEDCSSCASDCGTCAPVCGDGVCEGAEDCSSCASDCGTCSPVCGDGVCEESEDCSGCEGDCGPCAPVCGDGVCDGSENCSSCEFDCEPCDSSACAELAANADVVLRVGDDFQAANDSHPSGTIFLIGAGTHTGQRVRDPRQDTIWVAEPGAVMDGGGALTDAFHGSATGVQICGVEIRDYVDNGIHFSSGSHVVIDSIVVYLTGSGSGESNGAVRLDNMSDLTVVNSHFERVSSGVLPSSCTGPIVIEHNTGMNIGRNFVQLAWVDGAGIRVRYNSMERDGSYLRSGNDDVEDWISVYSVRGTAQDPVQISYNRARGHGPSRSGSFIMLGDGGGAHQEAVGNIGVTPGQVGIGLSGGYDIVARDNAMYSDSWHDSNIAYYSADYGTGGCGDHYVLDNRANWTNRDGRLNSFWSSGVCTPLTESGNAFPDASLTADIWDTWMASTW